MAKPSVLFVLFQMGTLDHVLSLYRQLRRAGTDADVAIADPLLEPPQWFREQAEGVRFIDQPHEAVARGDYDVVIVQMPYDDLKPDPWKDFGREQAFTVYAGYAVPLGNWHRGDYELPFYQRCSLTLASSPDARRKYLKSETPPEDSLWSGDPLLWEIASDVTQASSGDGVPVIMWAPHWSETWISGEPGFSNWKVSVHDILWAARKFPHSQFIVRGHPMISLDGSTGPAKRAASAFASLIDLPNVTKSTVSMREDIAQATALITDGVSIVAYYSATSKPLAVVRPGYRWPPFNASGRALVNAAHSVTDSRSTRSWLTSAATGIAEPNLEGQQLVAQLFPLADQSPGQMLLNHLPRTR